jgi:hypothetical protein
MSRVLSAGAAAFLTMAGTAMAQTTTIITTSPPPPPPAPVIVAPPPAPPVVIAEPPLGTLSTTHSQAILNPDGSQSVSRETTYRNGNGVADDRVTSTTIYPPVNPPVAVTTRQHIETTVTQ